MATDDGALARPTRSEDVKDAVHVAAPARAGQLLRTVVMRVLKLWRCSDADVRN